MEESNETTLATFKVPVTDWEKFKAISKSKGKTASFFLTQFVSQTIAAEENLPPKTSPDKFITHENLVAAIAPLVARIEVLEKGSGIVEIVDPRINGMEIYMPIPGQESSPDEPTPDPTPPVDESPKSCFDLVGTVPDVAEVPGENEQIPESPGADTTVSEVPDTIPEPTEFSQKTIDEVLNARPPVPEGIIYDHDGIDVTDPEMKRFFAGQLTHWTTVADALGFPRDHFESASASEKFQKEVETVICSDENLYRWIGEMNCDE